METMLDSAPNPNCKSSFDGEYRTANHENELYKKQFNKNLDKLEKNATRKKAAQRQRPEGSYPSNLENKEK